MVKGNSNIIWIMHAILLFFLFFKGLPEVLNDVRFYATVLVLAAFLGLKFFYDFRNSRLNLAIIAIYYLVFAAEVILIPPAQFQFGGLKGVLFDIFANAIPFIYIGVRLFSALALVGIYFRSRSL
jgi:hypothetical protein